MPYIGQQPTSVAFLTDTFSGNGSTTAFTLSAAPANTSSVLVAVSGVLQDPSTYSVVGTTLTFSPAPPPGTGNISVRFLGIPASGVTTTAYRTVTEFTATAGQTTFSVPSYTPGFIDVYRNGVMLGSADYTASNGVSVVLASGATAGDLVEVISFSVSSVLNAIPATAGSVGTSNIANGVTINFADGSASTPSITNDGDTNTGMFFPAADTIAFAEGGVEQMRLNSVGNLGLGIVPTGASGFLANKLLEMGGASAPAVVFRPSGSTSEHTVLGAGDGLVLGATGAATASNNTIRFFTSNTNSSTTPTERMRIDSAGRVTTPFQPAFYAMMNNTNYGPGNNTIIFEDVYVNIGSHYNSANGRFTAPVAGTYHFSANFLKRSSSGRLVFQKNGSYYGSGTSQTYSGNVGSGEIPHAATIIITLAVGDYVTVVASVDGGDVYGDSNCHNGFSGFLIG